jgi:hypothetical protein
VEPWQTYTLEDVNAALIGHWAYAKRIEVNAKKATNKNVRAGASVGR